MSLSLERPCRSADQPASEGGARKWYDISLHLPTGNSKYYHRIEQTNTVNIFPCVFKFMNQVSDVHGHLIPQS